MAALALIYLTWSGSACDLFGPDATVTSERQLVADFVVSILPAGVTLLVRTPDLVRESSYTALIKPFSANVWFSVLVIISVLAFLYWVIEGTHLNPVFMSKLWHNNIADSLWGSLCAFFGHSLWTLATSHGGRSLYCLVPPNDCVNVMVALETLCLCRFLVVLQALAPIFLGWLLLPCM